MSLYINQVTNSQLTTDRQRARATEFVNRNDNDVTHMATRSYNIAHRDDNKKFVKNLKTTIYALPVAAVASDLVLKKGIKPSMKNGAYWGVAVAAPAIVSGVSKAFSKPNEFGKKEENLSFGSHLALTLGTYFAGSFALDKLSQNKTVNKVVDTVIDGIKDTAGKIKNEVKIPETVSQKFTSIKSSIKMPEFVKPVTDKIANSQFLKNMGKDAVSLGKKVINHAPGIMAFGMLGAIIGHGIKQGSAISANKNAIKNAQLETARNLINSYQQENQALKQAQTEEV